jgi:nitrite reductase/ring-hydroxylating ferredoxin subunit/DMSO/TMAO reductase YedYZ heme-binding membrane subunit
MSSFYRAVNWNRQKFIYDGLLASGVAVYLLLFTGLSLGLDPGATLETTLIRGLGTAALVLLHLILCIGPLARLDPAWLPLLYNRRHLGVVMGLLALAHATFSLIQFHTLGDVNPLISLLTAAGDWRSVAAFPFELPGILALLILLLMAATSHDYWLATLSAPVWKALHMLVYVAYALLIAHVALGNLQATASPALTLLLGAGFTLVLGLHLVTGARERPLDASEPRAASDGWVPVCRVDEIAEDRAKMATVGGERVAVFRYDGKVSCVSNVCQHQNGPLGEGKIIDGCITCPWHGYQYLPDSGQSPPPFSEKIPTFNLVIREGVVLVDPRPNPAGTRVEPVRIAPGAGVAGATHRVVPAEDPFYVGYHPAAPVRLAVRMRRIVTPVLVIAAVLAVALALTQDRADPGVFEYGHLRALRGQLRELPYPSLVVPGAGLTDRDAAYIRYLLVAEGKHGAQTLTAGHDGAWVELTGTRIAREGQEMLELAPDGLRETPPPGPSGRMGIPIPLPVSLGVETLTGEIVDSKCWLGVMKPATRGVHRGCATRCLSGGIPPLLLVRDPGGATTAQLLLVGADGRAAHERFKALVGRDVELTGEVIREGDLLVMRVATVVTP